MAKAVCWLSLICELLLAARALACDTKREDVGNVLWMTPEDWDGYVDAHGQGLYVDIMNLAFGPSCVPVKRLRVPFKRAMNEVALGHGDVTGGIDATPAYHQSRFPLFEAGEFAFYRRKASPLKNLPQDLERLRGVWALGYVAAFPQDVRRFLRGQGVTTRSQAARMVVEGRSDYYVDNADQMKETLGALDYDPSKFACDQIFRSTIYMSFTRSKRGQILRDIFDASLERSIQSGHLQLLYEKWRLPFPDALRALSPFPRRTLSKAEQACPEARTVATSQSAARL